MKMGQAHSHTLLIRDTRQHVQSPSHPGHRGATACLLDDAVETSVELHNASSHTVEEVAQLYLHQRYGRAARPVRELKALERVTLKPGETRTLRFEIPAALRHYWNAAHRAYVLDKSDFDVWVGGALTAELHAEFAVRDGAD